MMGITGVCSRFIGDLVQALGVARPSSAHIGRETPTSFKPQQNAAPPPPPPPPIDDDLMNRALTAVFGMENNGKIKKEKARCVVENLGLMYNEDDDDNLAGAMEGDEVLVEEVLGGLDDKTERHELLVEAFKIFDEDGNGYIEAVELKRVLQCLGLDNGLDMKEIEKMLTVVDLNLDGKVDFDEFELMMG